MSNSKKTKTYGKNARPAGGYLDRKQSVVNRLEEAGRIHGKTPQQIKQEEKLDSVFLPEVEPEPESKNWFDALIFGD